MRHYFHRTFAVTILAASACILAVPAGVAGTPSVTSIEHGSDANSARSQATEQLALRILATPKMQQALARGLTTLGESKAAAKPEAMRYAKSALNESGMFASLNAAMAAAPEPSFIWIYAPPRRWNGYTLPGSRWYADNVDTMYRVLRVDQQASYEISVLPAEKLPAQLSFMVYDWLQHNGMNPRNDVPLGTITISEDTPRNADGSITLTVGPDPARGRPNHIELKPGARQVLAREIRGDWSQPMVRLAVRRTGGPAQASKSFDELVDEAVQLFESGVNATINISVGFGNFEENALGRPQVRWLEETGAAQQTLKTDDPVGPDRALGFLSSFLFNLKEDEAFVFTVNTLGARYVGVNSYRPFFVSPEHVHGSSSSNNTQAKPNPDGSFTFVIARRDPGVYNWIDVGGLPYGAAGVRWQTLTTPVVGSLENAVQWQKVVKISDLRSELPATTVWVTPKEREQLRDERARQYMLRCLGTPCEVGGELDKKY